MADNIFDKNKPKKKRKRKIAVKPPAEAENPLNLENKAEIPEEEALPEVKVTSGSKVYFSVYKGLKIGIQPTRTYVEVAQGQKIKRTVPGHQIKFNNGRYSCQPRPDESDKDFVARKAVEEEFLDDYMRRKPNEVFTVNPAQTAIAEKLKVLQDEERRILAGEAAIAAGRQGVVGAK